MTLIIDADVPILPGEQLDDLQNDGYHILQHPGLFRFGTDAVLLQNFVRVGKTARVVDLGTGTGILAILLCAHNPGVQVDAVEIQERAANMAARSVRLNRLQERVRIHTLDLAQAPQHLGNAQYDAVMCNPPYGKPGATLKNPNDALCIARHEVLTTLADCVCAGSKLLRNGGKYFMIHQADRLFEIAHCMAEHHLQLKRVRLCHPRLDLRAHLVLLEAVKQANPGTIFLPPLILRDQHGQPTHELTRIYAGQRTV